MNKPKLKTQDYNLFIQQLELLEIAMESAQFRQRRMVQPNIKCKIDFNGNVINWKSLKDNREVFRYKAIIKIKQKNRIIFETNCTYVLFFESKRKFPKKYYKEFVINSKHLQAFLWPYLRQWFADVTERVLLPRFTAPLIKSLIKSPIPKIKKKKK